MGSAIHLGGRDGSMIVRELAPAEPAAPVLSIRLRTDPRDPANTNHVRGWLIALRNGPRRIAGQVDEHGTRGDRLAVRDLAAQAEGDLVDLTPAARGRGLSYFRSADAAHNRFFSHQLAPRRDVVCWHPRPFVSPLGRRGPLRRARDRSGGRRRRRDHDARCRRRAALRDADGVAAMLRY